MVLSVQIFFSLSYFQDSWCFHRILIHWYDFKMGSQIIHLATCDIEKAQPKKIQKIRKIDDHIDCLFQNNLKIQCLCILAMLVPSEQAFSTVAYILSSKCAVIA